MDKSEELKPIFEVGELIFKESFNPTIPVTISKIEGAFYYTEQGIIIPIELQDEWTKFGEFKTGDEILVPGKIVQSSGDTYHVTFPWPNKGHVCRCYEDSWIVPKIDADKVFIRPTNKNENK